MRFWGVKGFHLYKSFSFTATGSPERLPRQLLVKLDPTKIWLRKTCIFSYIKIWRKAAQAVDLGSLLSFLLHWNVLEVSAAIYLNSQTFSLTKDYAFLNALIDVEGSLFKKRPFISFFFNQCFSVISFKQSTIPWLRFHGHERVPINISPGFMHFKTQQWTSPPCLCSNFCMFSV